MAPNEGTDQEAEKVSGSILEATEAVFERKDEVLDATNSKFEGSIGGMDTIPMIREDIRCDDPIPEVLAKSHSIAENNLSFLEEREGRTGTSEPDVLKGDRTEGAPEGDQGSDSVESTLIHIKDGCHWTI